MLKLKTLCSSLKEPRIQNFRICQNFLVLSFLSSSFKSGCLKRFGVTTERSRNDVSQDLFYETTVNSQKRGVVQHLKSLLKVINHYRYRTILQQSSPISCKITSLAVLILDYQRKLMHTGVLYPKFEDALNAQLFDFAKKTLIFCRKSLPTIPSPYLPAYSGRKTEVMSWGRYKGFVWEVLFLAPSKFITWKTWYCTYRKGLDFLLGTSYLCGTKPLSLEGTVNKNDLKKLFSFGNIQPNLPSPIFSTHIEKSKKLTTLGHFNGNSWGVSSLGTSGISYSEGMVCVYRLGWDSFKEAPQGGNNSLNREDTVNKNNDLKKSSTFGNIQPNLPSPRFSMYFEKLKRVTSLGRLNGNSWGVFSLGTFGISYSEGMVSTYRLDWDSFKQTSQGGNNSLYREDTVNIDNYVNQRIKNPIIKSIRRKQRKLFKQINHKAKSIREVIPLLQKATDLELKIEQSIPPIAIDPYPQNEEFLHFYQEKTPPESLSAT